MKSWINQNGWSGTGEKKRHECLECET
jgi:hypothetical protein